MNPLASAALVKVSSETDFASRSPIFSNFVKQVAIAASTAESISASSVEPSAADDASAAQDDFVSAFALLSSNAENNNEDGKSLNDCLNDAILAIRENIRVDTIALLRASSPSSILGGYVHGKASPEADCGSAASVVELVKVVVPASSSPSSKEDGTKVAAVSEEEEEGGGGDDVVALQEAAKKLAMHIVAAKPLYLTVDSVPHQIVQKEMEILTSKMDMEMMERNKTQKPEIRERILAGQMRKFYEGACLTEQAHMVEEGNPKVSEVLRRLGVEVKNFKWMSMGK